MWEEHLLRKSETSSRSLLLAGPHSFRREEREGGEGGRRNHRREYGYERGRERQVVVWRRGGVRVFEVER
jgi:hypothetical protein